MNPSKNSAISIVRVVGMFLIIFCHLATWYNLHVLAQLFNVGVPLFLFISGYLYSNRKIENYKDWFKKKFLKICIPLYIFMLFLFIFQIVVAKQEVSLIQILGYLFNLQGIGFILPVSFPSLQGSEHLWFLTAIMFCYFALAGVKKLETNSSLQKKVKFSTRNICFLLFAFLLLQCALNYVGINLNFFLIFFIGYFVGGFQKKISKHLYLIITILMIIALGTRIVAQSYLHDIILYNSIIAPLTQDIFAIWIYSTVTFVSLHNSNAISRISNSKLWNSLDKISYYVYITHYMFLVGPFNLKGLTNNTLLDTVLFFVAAFLSAFLLYVFYKLFYSCIQKKK